MKSIRETAWGGDVAGLGASRSRRRFPGGRWLVGRPAIVGLGTLALLMVILLLLITTQIAFRDEARSAYTWQNFEDIYSDPFAYKTLLNTVGFALVTVLTALFFGVPIAWLAERTNLPGRGMLHPLMTVGLLVPGFFTAMGWLFLFHPRIGIVNRGLISLFGLEQAPFNIATVYGMGLVQGLGLSSLVFIMTASSFQAMDPALEESAEIHGIRLLKRLRAVTLPLMWPGVLAAAIYVFMIGLAVFDIPAIIGLGNRIYTYSTFVYMLVNPVDGLPKYGIAAAASVIIVVVALVLGRSYFRVVQRSHRYAVVRGQGYRPKPIELGSWGVAAGWGFVGAKTLLSLVLPGLALLWAALQPYLEPISVEALQRLTLDNFLQLPWRGFWIAAKNSAIVVFLAPTLTTIFAIAISWVVVRSRSRVASLFDTLAFIPLAIPSIVFAIGALLLALFWLPRFVPFYGTVWILVFVDVIIRLSFATRILNGALLQIHPELDEAGYVFGLRPGVVVRKVLCPLLAPAILHCWVWMALLAYRELTVASLLVTRANITVPVFIWGIWSNGGLGQAAALTILLAMFMLPFVVLYFALGRERVGLAS